RAPRAPAACAGGPAPDGSGREQGESTVPHAQLVDRNTLARELTDLADRPPLAARRDELRALADDLRSGDDLDQWAEVDLLRAYARPDCLAPVTPPPRRHGVLRRLVAF